MYMYSQSLYHVMSLTMIICLYDDMNYHKVADNRIDNETDPQPVSLWSQ